MTDSKRSPDYEHVYNAIMTELRGYIHGSECNMERIREWLSSLPSGSVSSLLEQLRRNLENWKDMGSITEEQYSKGLRKLREIKGLTN